MNSKKINKPISTNNINTNIKKRAYYIPQQKNDSFEYSKPKKNKRNKIPRRVSALIAAALLSLNIPVSVRANQNKNSDKINIDGFSYEYFEDYNEARKPEGELENAVNEDLNKSGFFSKSSIRKGEDLSDELKELVAQEGNQVNGYIDNYVAQGITGDCWLITGIENLSYTEKGAKALYDSISINKNGNIDVYLKGPNLTYTVTLDELKEENKHYTLLSHGDDDMLVFEIAVNKFRQDIADKKIKPDENLPFYIYYTTDDGYNALTYGEVRQAYWLFTGIIDSQVAHKNKEDIDKLIEQYKKDQKNSLMSVSFYKKSKTNNMDGKEITLIPSHTYGIKDITEDTITLINPYQNIEEFEIPINNLYELPVEDLIYCNLDQN